MCFPVAEKEICLMNVPLQRGRLSSSGFRGKMALCSKLNQSALSCPEEDVQLV